MNSTLTMNKPPASALNTSKGLKEVAAWLDARAVSNECSDSPGARVTIGCLSIQDYPSALWQARDMMKTGAYVRGNYKLHFGCPSACFPVTGKILDPITRLDAVRAYGSPEAGLAAITRQLDVQRADMDPADVKRCEKAAAMIGNMLAEQVYQKRLEDEAEAESAIVNKAKQAHPETPLGVGTVVYVKPHGYAYKGTVVSSRMKHCRILGSGHPKTLHYKIQLTHKRETQGKLYAFHYSRRLKEQEFKYLDVFTPVPVYP